MPEPIRSLLAILLPACASFGPLFLVFGILGRTAKSPNASIKMGNVFLFAGGAMVTVVLWSLVMFINAPR